MKHHPKYPNKLTVKGYLQKKFEEYKSSGKYYDLLDDEMNTLLGFVLLEIHVILGSSKEKLQQNMELLLKLDSLSVDEYAAIPNDRRKPSNTFDALALIIYNPTDAVGLIENNMKVKFRSDKQSQCEMFLREVTPNCIKEVVEVNQVKSTTKKVRFSEDVVSKSEDCPSSPTKTSQTSSSSMNYQYAYHRSSDNVKKIGNKIENNETSHLEEKESVTPSTKGQENLF